MDPKLVFVGFLQSQRIEPAAGCGACSSVEELVDLNYDAMTEPCLRALAATAMREFNSNSADKVSWGLILDSVRENTSKRRASAEKNLMGLLSYCSNLPPASDAGSNSSSKISSDKALVIKKCRECYEAGQCDKTFMELLMNTRDACRQHAGSEAAAAADENVVMIEFFIRCFTALFLKDSKGTASAQLPAPPGDASTDSAAAGARPSKAVAATAAPPASTTVAELEQRLDQVEILDERQLMSAGTYMTQLIRHCNGNVSALKAAIILLYRHGDSDTGHGTRPAESASGVPLPSRYELNRAAFRRMLSDNLQACVTAGYVNKRRLFELIISTVENLEEEEQRATSGGAAGDAAGSAAGGGAEASAAGGGGGVSGTAASTYHAPQFLENETRDKLKLVVEAPRSFIDGTRTSNIIMTLSKGKGSSSVVAGAGHSNKHKADKRMGREITGQLADSVASHMKEHGYAVCDHFLPAELVRRIRTECGLFQDYYEASEIWVGKQADVGAHLTVPSVRGDRVLWMCGAHPQDAAPEGITRRVATLGEVEPCRLNIKAIAPVRKFVALKEFIQRVDAFVHELKGRVTRLAGIYERSDVMFSIYPGKGARFANHIDNTTRDGRVLSVVAYLNPAWEVDNGGAIRVQVPPQYRKQDSAESSSSGAAGEDVTAKHCVDVFPECGRIVMFYSDEIPHEVCPTYAERHACTIWYYDSTERKEAVQRAAESGRAAEAQIAGIEVQTEARTFIAELMGRDRQPLTSNAADESAASVAAVAEGIDEIITAALLAELNDKVQNSLSAEALKIVANITGAPSPESFKEGFKLLVPEDLRNIRQLFRRMGLTEAGTM